MTSGARRRGNDIRKLRTFLALLVTGEPLPPRYNDHPLKGPWTGYRDAHIEPDWIVLYRIDAENLLLERTGRHSDLFDE